MGPVLDDQRCNMDILMMGTATILVLALFFFLRRLW
jgi:hypothetical protein